jgi:predicted metal-dependent hydrolase
MGRVQPQEPAFDPARWSAGDAAAHFARGIELFNACEYEEAHEEFELLWLSTQGPDSDFYKGLVQAAIALHHFRRGNLEGTAKLYGGHRRYLAAYLPVHLGVDVAAFLREMQAALSAVVRRIPGADPHFDPDCRPRLRPS